VADIASVTFWHHDIEQQDVVDSHFGSITVESEEEKGTTFLITLPLNPSTRTEHKIPVMTASSTS